MIENDQMTVVQIVISITEIAGAVTVHQHQNVSQKRNPYLVDYQDLHPIKMMKNQN